MVSMALNRVVQAFVSEEHRLGMHLGKGNWLLSHHDTQRKGLFLGLVITHIQLKCGNIVKMFVLE